MKLINKFIEILNTPEFWYFFIPLVIGLIIYFRGESVKAEKKHLLLMFKANQTLSNRIQDKLRSFIIVYNASEGIAIREGNVTFGTWLELMTAEHETALSEERYNGIRKNKIPKPTLLSMSDSLNKQNEHLRMMELEMNLVIKKTSEGRV